MNRVLLAVPVLAMFAVGQEPAKPGAAPLPLRPAAAPQGQPDQAELEKRRDAKLAKDFLKQADWHTDYAKAKAEAKKTGRLIFTYFSRSYAA